MTLEKTKCTNRKNAPNFYWFHTFYEKQIDAKRRYEKIKIKTNATKRKQ
jgi:hypothetical protein